MQLKGEMSMLNVLHIQDTDVNKVCSTLEQKRDEAPQFFMQSPLVIDGSELSGNALDLDFSALKEGLLELGFIPVGVRNFPEAANKLIRASGWAIMRAQQAPSNTADTKSEPVEEKAVQAEAKSENTNPATQTIGMNSAMTVDRPVRSGQQIYAANADMTVLAPTSAGSEIMADGSIHIYGALRGRVLAGAQGNENARIYCQSLQAELVAIAGRYQLFDELDTNLKGKPAMIRLEGEKLIVEAL
ncbi:MAG: septum site-determining protein MinC [Cocleimonas sp.]|nr:septum site-determining protein MinC [Cocleimonas sp.]